MSRPIYILAAAVVVLAIAIVLATFVIGSPLGSAGPAPSPVCRLGGSGGLPVVVVPGFTCPPVEP